MQAKSFQVSNKLYLVRQALNKATAVKSVHTGTNHVFVCDTSGSMWGELDRIRAHFKQRLVHLLEENDTFSALWFSGRGECGILLEGEPVATLKNLKTIEAKIDEGLRARGLTGFKDPLEKSVELVNRLSKKNSNPFAFCFMSDGYDNQWNRNDILKATEAVGAVVQSATFVEYGYYADRQLLTQMAEKCGGSLIFAEDFNRYAPNFEAIIQRRPVGGKRVEVKVEGDAVGGFAFAVGNGELVTYAVTAGVITVPEGLSEVFYLSPTIVGLEEGELSFSPKAKLVVSEDTRKAVYAAISLNAVRMNSDVVFALLKTTGDVALIEQFTNCFGKQKYSEFMDAAKDAAFDAKKRHAKGYDPKRVPREDAFTVLDVISLLQEDPYARVLLSHPDFIYKKIGRSRVDADELLTDEEQAEINRITSELGKTKDPKKIKDLTAQLATVTDSKKAALKFVDDPAPSGYEIDGLTFNEDRPNVSFRVKKPGKVDLSARLPDEFKGDTLGKIPSNFPTFVYRNFTVIKDGLVNLEKLPVKISKDTYDKLRAEEVVSVVTVTSNDGLYEAVLDLRSLPVINRQMVKKTSAKDFFTTKLALAKAKAAQKVYNGCADELLPPRKSEGFASLYGDDAAAWLKEQGLTEFSGFQPPKTTQAQATDQYLSRELKTSIKGLSTLPKVAEVREKLAKNAKLNAGGLLMADAVRDVGAFLASDVYQSAANKDDVFKEWLTDRRKTTTAHCRKLMRQIAQTTFTTVVGQVWFAEFSSMDENSLTIEQDGQKFECKVEMKESEVKI